MTANYRLALATWRSACVSSSKDRCDSARNLIARIADSAKQYGAAHCIESARCDSAAMTANYRLALATWRSACVSSSKDRCDSARNLIACIADSAKQYGAAHCIESARCDSAAMTANYRLALATWRSACVSSSKGRCDSARQSALLVRVGYKLLARFSILPNLLLISRNWTLLFCRSVFMFFQWAQWTLWLR